MSMERVEDPQQREGGAPQSELFATDSETSAPVVGTAERNDADRVPARLFPSSAMEATVVEFDKTEVRSDAGIVPTNRFFPRSNIKPGVVKDASLNKVAGISPYSRLLRRLSVKEVVSAEPEVGDHNRLEGMDPFSLLSDKSMMIVVGSV